MKNMWGPNDIAVRPVFDRAERDRWDETGGTRRCGSIITSSSAAWSARRCGMSPWLRTGNGWRCWVGKPGPGGCGRARVGWTPEQRGRRLHLVANNARLLILPRWRQHNLASHIPQHPASVGRLSGGIRPSSPDGGDFCRSGPFRGNVLPGGELASRWVHKRVRTRAAVTANMERPEKCSSWKRMPASNFACFPIIRSGSVRH